jgi:hypothetical protein
MVVLWSFVRRGGVGGGRAKLFNPPRPPNLDSNALISSYVKFSFRFSYMSKIVVFFGARHGEVRLQNRTKTRELFATPSPRVAFHDVKALKYCTPTHITTFGAFSAYWLNNIQVVLLSRLLSVKNRLIFCPLSLYPVN